MSNAGERALQALHYQPVLHPFLVALFPVIGLYANNVGRTPVDATFRSAVALVVVALVVWLALSLVFRGLHKGGAVASVLLFAGLSGWTLLEHGIAAAQALGITPAMLLMAHTGLMAALVAWFWRGRRTRPFSAKLAAGLVALAVTPPVLAYLTAPVFGAVAAWFIWGYLLLTGLALGWLLHRARDWRGVTVVLNRFTSVMAVLFLAYIFAHWPERGGAAAIPEDRWAAAAEDAATPPGDLPDIYLIFLEGYDRADVLLQAMGYNNMGFLTGMEALGFDVVTRSTANYEEPGLALAACLNVDYPHTWIPEDARDGTGPLALSPAMRRSRVAEFLAGHGYELLALSPGVEWMEPRREVFTCLEPASALAEFEWVLLNKTVAFRVLGALDMARHGTAGFWPFVNQRQRVLEGFEALARTASEPADAPRFVLAPMKVPGWPFIFERDGSRATPIQPPGAITSARLQPFLGEFRPAYLAQLDFTNRRLRDLLEHVTTKATRPSVVVVASSRGMVAPIAAWIEASPTEKAFANFMMVRFPEGLDAPPLPEDTSLANVMGHVLAAIFDAPVEPVPDRLYATAGPSLFNVEPVEGEPEP
jgi:hypothetical protein